MTEIELKPCPFCGGRASFNPHGNSSDGRVLFRVVCGSRGCCGCEHTDDKTKAAEAWNRRPMSGDGLFDRIRTLAQSRAEYWKTVPLESFDEGDMDILVGQFQEIANDIAAAAAAVRDRAGEGVANPLPVYNIPQID